MKFREWIEAINKQSVAIGEVSESICADGSTISITVRKDRVEAKVNGRDFDLRHLRQYFALHKDNFGALLDSIVQQCESVAQTSEVAMSVATYEAIPGAVIDRLKGEGTDDTMELLTGLIQKRLGELLGIVKGLSEIAEINFTFPDLADRRMTLHLAPSAAVFRWGIIKGVDHGNYLSFEIPSLLQEELTFLANFEVIKKRIQVFRRIILELEGIGSQ